MQFQATTKPIMPVIPPRMGTSNIRMPARVVSAREVFRRQKSLGSPVNNVQHMAQIGPNLMQGSPMSRPRMTTSAIPVRSDTMKQPHIPITQKFPTMQPTQMPQYTTRTVVVPQKQQVLDASPKKVYQPRSPSAAIPRQNTGFNRMHFLPRYHVTHVYPCKEGMGPNFTPAHKGGPPKTPGARMGTSPLPRQGTQMMRPQGYASGHMAFRGRNQTKANASKRSPSMFKQVVDTIMDHSSVLPKVEAKEAVQLVGGFVSGTISVLAHIVGDIRSDIINGLFKGEDPGYDAAKAYYYAANNHPTVPSGMTQRIDYIEEIEKCGMSGSQRKPRRENTKPTPTRQAARATEFTRPPVEHKFEYKPQLYPPAPAQVPKPVVQQPTTFGQNPQMFSMMSERTLEEFLMNDGYLNSAPPSIPR